MTTEAAPREAMSREEYLRWHKKWGNTVHNWAVRGILTRLNMEAVERVAAGNSPRFPVMVAEFFAAEPKAPIDTPPSG